MHLGGDSLCMSLFTGRGSPFVAPLSGPTRLADLNQIWDARLILFVYFSFVCFLFQKCLDPNPRSDPNGGSEPELSLFRPFSFILSKHLFMSFHFRIFNYAEAFQMVGPKTFTLIQFVYKMVYHAFTK